MREQRTNINLPCQPPEESLLRACVNAADADWIGIQTSFDPSESSLVFKSRETGDTLSIKFQSQIMNADTSFQAEFASQIVGEIKKQLNKNRFEVQNRRVSVNVSTLEDLRQRAGKIESDLSEILGGKNGKANS